MPASAVADIRNTYGAVFIGLILSAMCVVSHPLFRSFAELVSTQPLWRDDGSDVSRGLFFVMVRDVGSPTGIIQMELLQVTYSDSLALLTRYLLAQVLS
jgi:hypothetical protein